MSSQSLRAPRPTACLGRSSAAPLGGGLVGRAGWRIQAAGDGPGSTSSNGPAGGPPSAAAGAGRRSEGYTGQELSGSCKQPCSFSDCPKEGGSGSAAAVAACFAEAGLEVWEAASIMDRNAQFAALQPWQLAEKLGIVQEILQGEAAGHAARVRGLAGHCLRSPLFTTPLPRSPATAGVEASKEMVLAKMCEAAACAALAGASNSELLRTCQLIIQLARDLCPAHPPAQAIGAVLAACDARRLCLLMSRGSRLSGVPAALEEHLGWSQQQAAAALLGLSATPTASPDARRSSELDFHPVHSTFNNLLFATPEHIAAVARALE